MDKDQTTPSGEQATDLRFEISQEFVTLTQGEQVIKIVPADAFKLTQALAGYLPLGLKAKLAAFLTATVAKTIG